MHPLTFQFPHQWGKHSYSIQPKILTLSVRKEVLPLLQDYASTSSDVDFMEMLFEYPSLATLFKRNGLEIQPILSAETLMEVVAENPTLFRLLKNPPLPLLGNEQRIRIAIEILKRTIDSTEIPAEVQLAFGSEIEHEYWQNFPLEILERYLEFFRSRFL